MAESERPVGLSVELERITSSLPPRYICKAVIGQGGMGAVLRAIDQELNREVAIKLMQVDAARSPELLQRFSREAKTLAGLNHANIVKMLSWGVTEQGCPFHVLEFLEGQSLSEEIAKKGKLKPAFIYAIFPQIFSGLQHAHDNGVVHRDLKPSNIIICKSKPESAVPLVKIIDFGIARLAGDQQELRLTQTNAVLGSPAYMSPEQCQSMDTQQSSDIYSLGCIMYEACTGKAPFAGESAMELMYKHVNSDWEHLEAMAVEPELKQLGKLIDSCLAKEAKDRPSSVKEIANNFQELNRSQADSLKFQQSQTAPGKKHTFLLLAACSAVLIAALLYLQINHVNENNEADVKDLLANRDNRTRNLKLEKSLSQDFGRLKAQLAKETNKERQREFVELLCQRGRELASSQQALGKNTEAQNTLKQMLEFSKYMDEPELGQVEILRDLAQKQLETQQIDLARQTIDRAMNNLTAANLESCEDASQLVDLKYRSYLVSHDLPEALAELRHLRRIWENTTDAGIRPSSQQAIFLTKSKDHRVPGIISEMKTYNELLKGETVEDKLTTLQIYNEYAGILLEREPALTIKALEHSHTIASQIPSDFAGASAVLKQTDELNAKFKNWQQSQKEETKH